ncbi:lipopolysaccharide heptosyltransferase family protein, partial [Klebsiella variicola]|nr:lipopolysaccharide heptosyltransferase family protein [Klebsiella variicola]
TFALIADYLHRDTRALDTSDLAGPGPIMQEVAQYRASLSGKAVVINMFAGQADRSLSQTQLAELHDKLRTRHPGLAV